MSGSSTLGILDPETDSASEQAPVPLLNQVIEANLPAQPVTAPITFHNYMQMRRVLPIYFWHILRVISVIFAISLRIILFIRPNTGLNIFWGLFIPALPLVFFAAPGLWRNICPMAALNQTPRLFSFSRNLVLPPRLKKLRPLLRQLAAA